MSDTIPAFCVAAAGSGSGKTTVTLGLLAALRRRGLSVAPFKCGPDYIDPGFHRAVCGVPSRNLDTWMMGRGGVRRSFAVSAEKADAAVVEGVMGLFDGAEPGRLSGSTADVAEALGIPVLLVVDAKGMAGTIAPIAKGLAEFEPGVEVMGIVANNVGSERHAEILKTALSAADAPPFLGYLRRDAELALPERHLGLVSVTEHPLGLDTAKRGAFLDKLVAMFEEGFDIDAILKLSERPRPVPPATPASLSILPPPDGRGKIALALDEAFHFYYEDNLDALKDAGWEIVPFSPLSDLALPDGTDWVYIGGGFPECFAERLERNSAMRNAVAEFADAGGAVYAECGGLMYLSENIAALDGKKHAMCGVIPLGTRMEPRLRSLGYREIRVEAALPFANTGTVFRGHEFHWSSAEPTGDIPDGITAPIAWRRAKGGEWTPAGYRVGNVSASYAHIHFATSES
jgi:cobyrinic acid a,c-diamide synthase